MTSPGVPDPDVELLPAPPRVGPLIVRAALTSRRRPGLAGALPGRRVVTTGVRVDPVRLAGYHRVCGLTVRDELPSTYLHVLTFPLQVHLMAGADFPHPMAGMVHVGNEMTLHRPVRVGEELILSTAAGAREPHRRGVSVTLLGRVEVGSETVWEGRSSYLVKGRSAPQGTQGAPPAVDTPPEHPPDLPWWAGWRLPADLGRRYAAVAGDVNPIHLHPWAARAFGYPRAIAHGMWTHARVLGALEGRLAPRHTVSVRFHRPVLLPSRVDLRALAVGGGFTFAVTRPGGGAVHLVGQVGPTGPPP